MIVGQGSVLDASNYLAGDPDAAAAIDRAVAENGAAADGEIASQDGNAAADPNVNLDIGQELDVPAWDANGRARVPYRGADWTVELAPNCAAAPGRYRIVEVRGSTLVVSPR